MANFARDHGKTFTLLACPCRFNRRVQRQNIGLESDIVNQEVIEPIRCVLSAMSSMVLTTVCIAFALSPRCWRPRRVYPLGGGFRVTLNGSGHLVHCRDGLLHVHGLTRAIVQIISCASLSLPSRTLTTWLDTSLINQRHISPVARPRAASAPARRCGSDAARCCAHRLRPSAPVAPHFYRADNLLLKQQRPQQHHQRGSNERHPPGSRDQRGGENGKSTAITRTRQRSGIAGSLPSQPFPTTSPL
jgi:hypothetical protein